MENTQDKFDQVAFIMEFEDGNLSQEEIAAGFQKMIDSGVVWGLQGSYIRTANALIEKGLCTRTAPPPTPTKLGPYEMVSRNQTRKVGNEEFRIVLYGAYNACGLIGPECNGIVVLSETQKRVVCDELGCETSGYYGPSVAQLALFETMMSCTDQEFCDKVNASKRARYKIAVN